MSPYADTNFFTKLYLVLPDSPAAQEWLTAAARKIRSPLPITWLHRLEVLNAFELHVFGGRHLGQARVTAEQAAVAQASFRHDLGRSDFVRAAPLGQDTLAMKFEEISLRHTARYGFRVYDIIHVASALLLGCDTFWSFDARACRLAALEGLKLKSR
jgi:predicted nucleic acid-binding protein